jgi:nucleotide-binding universal stress UspA family protein
MAKKILIPLDGSVIGEAALRYVEEMISNLGLGGGVDVILIHVLIAPIQNISYGQNISLETPLTYEEIEEMRQKALKYLEESGERLRSAGVDIKYEVLIRNTSGSSAEDIIKAEEDLDVDLVAMSTHGRRGISRWAFGSVTEKVLRGGNVPVLVVRAKK